MAYHLWRHKALLASSVLLASSLAACGGGVSHVKQDDRANPTINFFSNPDNSGATQKAVDTCNKSANGAYTINYQLLPSSSDEQHQQLTRRLSAKSSDIDVMAMDVNWTAEFAAAGWAEEWKGDDKVKATGGTLAPAVQSANYNGKLYGVPSNSNTQLLWYRRDLVPTPPKTWDEMFQMAAQLQQQGKPHLIEIQGAKYEGLTVWFNTLVTSAGGSILTGDATKPNTGDATLAAATIMRKQATGTWTDPSLPNQQEDQSRLAFEQGQAAFELNYPFVYPSAQKNVPELAKNMAWAPYPGVNANKPSSVTIGGINLGISSYSTHREKAFQAALCLRSPDNQKILATEGGLPPTLTALYDDPSVRSSYPFADDIRTSLSNASVRPQTPRYSDVSLAIQDTLSPPASIDVTNVNSKLNTALTNALGAKGLQ